MQSGTSKGKEIRIPGPDHPITIFPAEGKVRVTVARRTVAESTRALRLEEEGYPPVYYLPRSDAEMSLFEPSITAIVRTRVTVPTTAFRSVDRNRNMPFGRTKSLMKQSARLRSTWRFIPHGLMQSR
jgi:hypothetical protein